MLTDLMGYATEHMNLTQQIAEQQGVGLKKAWIGFIQQYDPTRHYCTVVNPVNSDINMLAQEGFTPMVTNWLPLGTGLAGVSGGGNPLNANVPNYGIQIAPFGGSSVTAPNAGEQVLVIEINSQIGYYAAAFMFYNDIAKVPGNSIPVSGAQLQNGEMLVVSPSGTTIHIDKSGNINVYILQVTSGSGGNLNLISNGGIGLATAVANTMPTIPAQGDIDIKALNDIHLNATDNIIETANDTLDLVATTGAITETAGTGISQTAGGGISQSAGAGISQAAVGAIDQTAGLGITQTAATTISISALGVVTITSGAQINLNASAVNVSVGTGTTYPLLTNALWSYITGHTHSGVQTGSGTSGPVANPPLEQYPNITSVLEAQ